MDLDQAVTRHAEWKMRFRTAISNQETLDAETITKDNCCEIGKWLHGDAAAKYEKLDSLKDCVSKHAAFHAEAGKVAKMINAKQYKEAAAMIDPGTPYSSASSAVAVAIMHLKKEAAL
ncbi:MAG: CZB domain-containing protein [Georgfuchsia sp.]